jgi:hypothetical protein
MVMERGVAKFPLPHNSALPECMEFQEKNFLFILISWVEDGPQ